MKIKILRECKLIIEFIMQQNTLISHLKFTSRSVFPEDYIPTSQVKRALLENHSVPPKLAEPLRRINCIHVFVHKTHKFEIIL